jgi:hypothetical protein
MEGTIQAAYMKARDIKAVQHFKLWIKGKVEFPYPVFNDNVDVIEGAKASFTPSDKFNVVINGERL